MTNDSNSTAKSDRNSKSRIRRPAKARLQSPHRVMPEEVEQYVEREEKDEQNPEG